MLQKLTLCLFSSTLFVTSQSALSQQELFAKDAKAGDNFGFSVAIDGNKALVGALNSDSNGVKDAGAAYIYSLSKGVWKQQAKLVAKSQSEDDTLGGNVALKGNMALLGASRKDNKGENSGAVVSFEKKSGLWHEKQTLTAFDGKAGDAFGQSIALTHNTLVIGAPHGDAPLKDSGAAYIFTRQNNAWQLETKIFASDGAAGDLFGISVAIDNNTIIVGADLNDEKAENAGAAYVFTREGDKWSQQAKLMSNDPGHTDIFGVRVAISGDTALISARRDDVDGIGKNAGSAYIFVRNDNKWTQQVKLNSPDGKADDRFGRGVALRGNTAVISAMHHDANGPNAGAVYIYKNDSGKWQNTSKVVANRSGADDKFGWNIAMSNTHMIVATPFRDNSGDESGAVYIQSLD